MKDFFNDVLSQYVNDDQITSYLPQYRGSINRSYKLLGRNSYFIKVNDDAPSDFFSKEARGLEILAETRIVAVPQVYRYGKHKETHYLLLEAIESAPLHKDFWYKLGEQLARLHQHHAPKHGLDHDNYIGILPQKNEFRENWIDFFINQRLLPQIDLADKSGLLNITHMNKLNRLINRLEELLPNLKPSLLHGDLWRGNVISNDRGLPVFIDPAICYANREMEIAFTKLFGGFDIEFYDSYINNYALEKDFDERIDIYILYPLLVHLNLFGKSYLSKISQIVNSFV